MKKIIVLVFVFGFFALRGECDCVSKQSAKKQFYSNHNLKAEYQFFEKCEMHTDVISTDENGESKKYKEKCQCDVTRDGSFKEYYENGKIKREGKYKDGLLEQELTEYSDKGEIIRKGFFHKGKFNKSHSETIHKVGGELVAYEYYENEILREERAFKEGELVSEKIYDETGKVISDYKKK